MKHVVGFGFQSEELELSEVFVKSEVEERDDTLVVTKRFVSEV